jgi:uncharacterized protein YkwD
LLLAVNAHAAVILRGDIDQNGKIGAADSVLALKAAVGLIPLDDSQKAIADVNSDTKINTADAVLILKRAVGLIDDLGTVDLGGSGIVASVDNNETVFDLPASDKQFATVKVTQGDKSVTTSVLPIEHLGDKDRVRIKKVIQFQVSPNLIGNQYAFFQGFTPAQPTTVDFFTSAGDQGPFNPAGEMTVTPSVHGFDPGIQGDRPPGITLTNAFPDTAKVGDTITLSGQALVDLRASAFIVPPSGFPVEIPLQSLVPPVLGGALGPKLASGSDYTLTFTVDTPGTYAVEISDYPGSAVLNRPIYVSTGVPLVPDVLDTQTILTPGATPDFNQVRADWLALVNQDRAKYGLGPVAVSDLLQQAAQNHTNDMIAQGYFGHIGLDGSTPASRAQSLGIPTTSLIGENLTQGFSAQELEAGLMASADHRVNILNSQWSHIGLAAGLSSNGIIFGSQEFEADAGEYNQPADYFPGVLMDQGIPTGFKVGQTVTLSGKVTGGAKSILIFFVNPTTKQQALFPKAPVLVGADGRFSIPVTFTDGQLGTFLMGISLDGSTKSKATFVIVNP